MTNIPFWRYSPTVRTSVIISRRRYTANRPIDAHSSSHVCTPVVYMLNVNDSTVYNIALPMFLIDFLRGKMLYTLLDTFSLFFPLYSLCCHFSPTCIRLLRSSNVHFQKATVFLYALLSSPPHDSDRGGAHTQALARAASTTSSRMQQWRRLVGSTCRAITARPHGTATIAHALSPTPLH